MDDGRKPDRSVTQRRGWLLEAVVLIVGIVVILVTFYLTDNLFPFMLPYRDYLLSLEVAVVSVLLVELIGRVIVSRFREHGNLAYGIYIRTVIRIIGYLGAVVVIISVLASNPALAISIGTITGVVIGFASQNITSNVLAAAFLITTRTVRVGDAITVVGNTGKIVDITPIYTVIETDTGTTFVPNVIMVTTAVQRRKKAQG